MLGNEAILKQLREQAESGRIPHAWLFSGEKGMGKKSLAQELCLALFCTEKKNGVPCRTCRNCRRILAGNHPDILYLTHEKPDLIRVEEIRTQLKDTVMIRPYEGGKKVYIIDEAEKMGIEAQNALLKTLEEPPEYAVLLLLTADAAKLLDTIRSRCRLLRPERIPEDTIRTFLIEEKGISPENAGLSAAFSGGNPGLAAELSESGEFRALYREAVTLLKNAASMDISELYEKAQSFVSEGVSLPELFSLLENWYRDVLLLKAGGSTGRLFFSGETAALQQISLRAKEETIGAVFEEIRKARQRLSANVNKEMTLQFLFLKLREV